MTLSPQADTFNIPSKSEDYSESIAPSGTVDFLDGENVGLHESDLDRITREATDIAVPMHPVTQHEKLDGHRIEYGQATMEAVLQLEASQIQPLVSHEKLPIDTASLLFFSAAVLAFRARKSLGDTAESQRS